jgi:hypothetical protein
MSVNIDSNLIFYRECVCVYIYIYYTILQNIWEKHCAGTVCIKCNVDYIVDI